MKGRNTHGSAGRTVALTLTAALLTLTGCSSLNPIGWYRDLTGTAKDDPGPDARNTANLEAGSKQDYPDINSVPSTPTRGLTEEQRKQLADGLIADRDHAQYADAELRGGNLAAVPPVPSLLPEEQFPDRKTPAPAAEAAPRPPAPVEASATPAAQATAAPPAQPPHRSRLVSGGALGGESALIAPETRPAPAPETPREPPPTPELPAPPPPQPVTPAVKPPPVAPEPTGPAQVDGVPVPAAPPVRAEPVPAAADLAPVPAPVASNARPPKFAHSTAVATLTFGADGSPTDPAALAGIIAQHQDHGGVIRVVGSATVGDATSADARLAVYQAGMARANAVKQALVAAGAATADIVVEAAPTAGADRAVVYVDY